MAERRMFAKAIIDSDLFIDMPTSARLLYFDLNMRADDDGFVNSPRKIIRMTGASNDDLRILISKDFVIPFESGVVVIKHWRIHNYIRKDRYKPTICIEEKQQLEAENSEYTLTDGQSTDNQLKTNGQPTDDQWSTQDRLGKDRLGKDSIEYQQIADMYNNTCVSFPRLTKLSDRRKKTIKARFNAGYTLDDFRRLFEMAEESDFLKGSNNRNWSATFDWLIQDGNMAKVLDGNYQNREPTQKGEKDNGETEDSYSIRLW